MITHLEPEVLDFTVEKGLPMRTKTLLTHSQLNKGLDNYRHYDDKPATPEQKIKFKQGLVRNLVGRRENEAKEIIHRTISDLRDGVPDLDSGIMYTHKRKDVMEENMAKSKEGRDMAFHSFWIGAEAMLKTINALTVGHLHEEKGEISLSDIPYERIDNVIKTYTIEIIKNLNDHEMVSMCEKLDMIGKLRDRIVPLMESEIDSRAEKDKMSGV